MKSIVLGCLLFSAANLTAQVGIGTAAPDNSAMLDVTASNKGFLFPRMTSLQRNAIAAPATGLYVFDVNSNSLWFYNGVHWINTSQTKFGDVKSGIQNADHDGWILLNGRAIADLTISQQNEATLLGLAGNIPNASNAFLVQDASPLGSVNGANTVQLTQSNLPAVSFTGTAASAGSHEHTTDPAPVNSVSAGSHDHTVDPVAFNSASAGAHNHTVDPAAVNSSDAGSHSHTTDPNPVNTASAGSHSHSFSPAFLATSFGWGITGGGNGFTASGTTTTSTAPDHQHSVDIPSTTSSINGNHAHSVDIPSTASSLNGDHLHSVDVPLTTSSTSGSHAHSVDIPSTTSSTNGLHTHNVSVSSGGSGTAVNIKPRSLTVNMFIYLGL